MLRLASVCACPIALALVGVSFAMPVSAPTAHMRSASPLTDGGPTRIEVSAPPAVRAAGGKRLAEFRFGRRVTAQSGCLACHKIGDNGNRGPGPNLTDVGSKLSPARIEHALRHPTAPMPSFGRLPPAKIKALVTFLSLLRR